MFWLVTRTYTHPRSLLCLYSLVIFFQIEGDSIRKLGGGGNETRNVTEMNTGSNHLHLNLAIILFNRNFTWLKKTNPKYSHYFQSIGGTLSNLCNKKLP